MSISDYRLKNELSPIAFNGGIAANMPGGLLPVISITQAGEFNTGVLSGSTDLNDADFLFNFNPLPGGTLGDFQIGQYPFANQTVAANAIISQPLRLSLMMLAPVNQPGAYAKKLAAFQALQAAIQQHSAQGGTYTVATPAYLYTDMILLGLRDVSDGNPQHPQEKWQWDFIQPLLTLAAATAAQNALMAKLTAGAPLTPGPDGVITYSGPPPSIGAPTSGVGPSVVPAAQPLLAASVGGLTPAPVYTPGSS